MNKLCKILTLLLCLGLTVSATACKEENKDGDDSPKESWAISEDTSKEDKDMITVCSYNIKCATYSTTWDKVLANIKQADPDIIGIQEVDSHTTRSGDYNQIEKLAKDLGYEYYYFAKTIDFAGGEYGHGILSKFPIKESKVVFFDNQRKETRNVERHVLDVNGKELVFYNTHLAGMPEQYVEIQDMMLDDLANGKHSVLTGDFNLKPSAFSHVFNSEKLIALNGYLTLNCGKDGDNALKSTQIDNIIVTDNIDTYMNENTMIGLFDIDNDASDHPMIYTRIQLK